ncbi:hypothetical protein ACLOJK_013947 [Asimina triloba]
MDMVPLREAEMAARGERARDRNRGWKGEGRIGRMKSKKGPRRKSMPESEKVEGTGAGAEKERKGRHRRDRGRERKVKEREREREEETG